MRPKLGRPTKYATKANRDLNVRVPDHKKAVWKIAACRDGLTLSAWVVKTLDASCDPASPESLERPPQSE